MRKINVSLIVLFVLSSMFSCIDSKYHWDNLDKEGVINLPPIPLGAFETIKLEDLVDGDIKITNLPQGAYNLKYSFRDLFGTSSIKNFFHDYVSRDILLEGHLEMFILGENSGIGVDFDFEVLDENDEVIDDIHIEGIKDVKYGIKDLTIRIPKNDIPRMREAAHLQMKISFTTPTDITLTQEDYIRLSKMIIKTAGYLVDL